MDFKRSTQINRRLSITRFPAHPMGWEGNIIEYRSVDITRYGGAGISSCPSIFPFYFKIICIIMYFEQVFANRSEFYFPQC